MSLFTICVFSSCKMWMTNISPVQLYDHDFCYTFVKWWYLQVLFSFFQNFDFLGCWWGKRTRNGPNWQKSLSVSCSLSLGTIHHIIVMIHMCKMISPGGDIFIFSKLWFSSLLGGKRAKNGPKLQIILSIALHISGLSCIVHICKMIIYPDTFIFFSFFQNFHFPGCRGGGGGGISKGKNGTKWQKVLYVTPCISGTMQHMIFIYGAHV